MHKLLETLARQNWLALDHAQPTTWLAEPKPQPTNPMYVHKAQVQESVYDS